MHIPEFYEIIESNDQTEARRASLEALRELVGNVYPNKFTRSSISGTEDTITNLKACEPVVQIVNEIKAVVATLAERERPPAEIKDGIVSAKIPDASMAAFYLSVTGKGGAKTTTAHAERQ
mgnify:CR=1 FL=1